MKNHKSIELNDDQLISRFPDVHSNAAVAIEFQRTLRIPDDNRSYHLPPGGLASRNLKEIYTIDEVREATDAI